MLGLWLGCKPNLRLKQEVILLDFAKNKIVKVNEEYGK